MKDLTGQRFGVLTVVAPVGSASGRSKKTWVCRCDCGNTTETRGDKLTGGRTKSCGCGSTRKPRMFTKDRVVQVIQNCATRSEFRLGHPQEYSAACRNGWLKEFGGHLRGCKKPRQTAHKEYVSDAVYIWRAIGWLENGVQVYKVGVSSASHGRKRVREGAWAAKCQYELVIFYQTKNCRDRELAVLSVGEPLALEGFNGSSEFVKLTELELAAAINIVVHGVE